MVKYTKFSQSEPTCELQKITARRILRKKTYETKITINLYQHKNPGKLYRKVFKAILGLKNTGGRDLPGAREEEIHGSFFLTFVNRRHCFHGAS